MNQVGAKRLGLTQDEYIGKSAKELFPPKVAEQMKDHVNLVFETGKLIIDESQIPFKDIVIYLDTRLLPLKNEKGEVAAVMGVSRDFTTMKMAEEALRESEEKYRTLSESSPDDIFLVELDGTIKYMNKAGLRRLGKKYDEVIGKDMRSLVSADAAQQVIANIEHVVKTGASYRYEDIIDIGMGIFYHDTVLNPIYDATGNISSILAISRDITSRVKSKQLSESLNKINTSISSSLHVDEIINIGIKQAAEAMDIHGSLFFLKDNVGWRIADVVSHELRDLKGESFNEIELPIISNVVGIKNVVSIKNNHGSDKVLSYIQNACGSCDSLAVPLIIKEEVTGIILFINSNESKTFSDDDIDFAKKLSVSMSLALENARIYTEERNIADTLQETQLILPDEIEKIELGHIYLSATEEAQVGGDFYDVFELDHNRTGIIIGDVSGKGLPAANLTTLVKNMIRAYSYENASPADIVSKTNKAVILNSDDLTFVTLTLGILEKSTGVFKYCNAGHPPAIVKRADGISVLKPNSSVIGIYEDLTFVDDKINLYKDDILFFYTDGLIEARADGEFFGEDRLREMITSASTLNAPALAEHIYKLANNFTDGKLNDDLAILTIEYKPEKVLRLAS